MIMRCHLHKKIPSQIKWFIEMKGMVCTVLHNCIMANNLVILPFFGSVWVNGTILTSALRRENVALDLALHDLSKGDPRLSVQWQKIRVVNDKLVPFIGELGDTLHLVQGHGEAGFAGTAWTAQDEHPFLLYGMIGVDVKGHGVGDVNVICVIYMGQYMYL